VVKFQAQLRIRPNIVVKFQAQLRIRPNIVVKFHPITSSGIRGVAFTRI